MGYVSVLQKPIFKQGKTYMGFKNKSVL